MSKHTPGPWSVWSDPEQKDQCQYIDAKGMAVAHVFGINREANARLIAAAPDLLEALIEMVDDFGPTPSDRFRSLGPARAAIAKATGEAA